jgi:HAD superfamily hydrolase (TIGR01509 family)
MNNKVIFFDVGGTLLESQDIFEVIIRRLAGRWPDDPTYHLYVKIFSGMFSLLRKEPSDYPFKSIIEVHAEALASISSRYGYPDISAQATDIHLDVYARRATYFPEAEGILVKLANNGVKMIVASDNESASLNIQIPKFGFKRFFSGYCISETAGAYKPAYKFISQLQKYLPENPGDCYFVGDSGVDVECGQRLGIKSVLVDRKHAGNVKIKADYTIHDLSGLLPILGIEI